MNNFNRYIIDNVSETKTLQGVWILKYLTRWAAWVPFPLFGHSQNSKFGRRGEAAGDNKAFGRTSTSFVAWSSLAASIFPPASLSLTCSPCKTNLPLRLSSPPSPETVYKHFLLTFEYFALLFFFFCCFLFTKMRFSQVCKFVVF